VKQWREIECLEKTSLGGAEKEGDGRYITGSTTPNHQGILRAEMKIIDLQMLIFGCP